MNEITWNPPTMDEKNVSEVARAADDLGIDADELLSAVDGGSLVELDEETWAAISNTESREIDKLKKAMKKAKLEGKKVKKILKNFIEGEVQAPIILDFGDGSYYLVDGETRLTLSHVLEITPTVWCVDFGSS